METLVILLVLAFGGWVLWQWIKARLYEAGDLTSRYDEDPAAQQEVRQKAEAAGCEYVLEPYQGGSGQGYTIRRVEDWQRLSWQRADEEDGLLPFGVAGESYRMDEVQDPGFAPGSDIVLAPEPDNPHSDTAVAVWNADETAQAGYVPSELSEEVGQLIETHPDYECIALWENRAEGERKSVRVMLVYGNTDIAKVNLTS